LFSADGGFALRRKDIIFIVLLLSLVEWDDDFDDEDDTSPPSGFHVDGELIVGSDIVGTLSSFFSFLLDYY